MRNCEYREKREALLTPRVIKTYNNLWDREDEQ